MYQTFHSGPRKGQPRKLQDHVIRYLEEALMFNEVDSKSRYKRFVGPGGRIFFVGKNGAVRTGKNASSSFSITHNIHPAMKVWEEGR